jgi:hypothetical protein
MKMVEKAVPMARPGGFLVGIESLSEPVQARLPAHSA